MTFIPFRDDVVRLKNDRISVEDADRQERTASEVLKRLERQPGVILADEVGMGKTFVALAVACSVVLGRPGDGPVVVMVPPSLKEKWPSDWRAFQEKCLTEKARPPIRAASAHSGVEFLRLLDDPPERRSQIIFLTHGALDRALSDGWIKLALIKRAFKGRSSLSLQRRNFGKFAGRLLRLGAISNRAPELLGDLVERPYDAWLRVIERSDLPEDDRPQDDPVPLAVQEALESMEGHELDDLVEALRQVPIRESANSRERIQEARASLSATTRALWEDVLTRSQFKSPLLILDEAHHLKNPGTRLASLFVDEQAARESELVDRAGPLGGKFERMLFLTATPFQLGHAELLRVLERFEGVSWKGRRAPALRREAFVAELKALGEILDKAQGSALRLDRAWGHLTPLHLVAPDGRAQTPEEWWTRVREGAADGVVAQILEQVQATRSAMVEAERALGPWVLRHLKSTGLPDATDVPRRTVLPGAAINDEKAVHEGLSIDPSVLLPFLLAGRAQSMFATCTKGRALFAEGLASSFEAYLETRDGKGDRDEEDEGEATDVAERAEIEWYLNHLTAALKQDRRARGEHPKVRATAAKAVDLWRRGEKVLIFCHYRATGRALRQHVSSLLEAEVVRLGRQKLPGLGDTEILERLEAIGRRFFDKDSPLRREVMEALDSIVAPFARLSEGERAKVLDVVGRFLRTPSFLVRYFELDRADDPKAFVDALDQQDESSLSLRRKVSDFCTFLQDRCSTEEERSDYLDALDKIYVGVHGGKEAHVDADADDEWRDAGLQPNVRLANGEVRPETRRRLLLAFNTPLFPEILIASSVLAEGVDLHLNCRYVIHHDLCWNPSTLEQRSGRVDRIGSKAEKVLQSIHLFLPYVAATQDEKMFRVVRDRERWFQIVMGEKYEVDEQATDKRAQRVELPSQLQKELSLHLAAEGREAVATAGSAGLGVR